MHCKGFKLFGATAPINGLQGNQRMMHEYSGVETEYDCKMKWQIVFFRYDIILLFLNKRLFQSFISQNNGYETIIYSIDNQRHIIRMPRG